MIHVDGAAIEFEVEGDAHTTYFPMPYWLDANGHGVLFDTDQRVNVSLCVPDDDGVDAGGKLGIRGDPIWNRRHGGIQEMAGRATLRVPAVS